MNALELMSLPTAEGRDGIHICAQLRVDAMHLQAHRVGWATNTMERAANHIEALERLLTKEPNNADHSEAVNENAEQRGGER